MTCPRCQAENRDGARFCRECGATFGAVCSGCGAKVEAGSKFCDSCGTPLAASLAQRTAPPRFASPESYTPKHLAEKILTSKGALEGERKQVTVLFADLKGSLELLADRDPEEARKLLDPVLERMMEAVHRYEGTVNQVMGDGIMALFGAPLAHEDHAVRACYAALRMQEAVKRYAEEVHRAEGVPIQIRVGLNSGEVVVRSIGSDLRMDYTAVGQTTHIAARMEQMAMPGAILVPDETLRLAEGYVLVKPLGERPVRGLEAPIHVYELVGAAALRSRLHVAAARGLTRFVGRDAELEQLGQALERARTGHGQIVAVVGEPGVGKSRLFWEFTHSHRTEGWLVLESSSVSYGKATPYLPVIDLLKAYVQIEPRDDQRKIREKLTGKLLTLDEVLRPTLPAFLALLDVPLEDPQWQALDPRQRRQRTLEAIKHLLLRESQVQPLCLVFEDLHWIDSETQALLESFVESLPTARILLLVNYRPEYQHGWGSKTYYIQLRIDPLPPKSAEELLHALLGGDPGLQPLKRLLIERTEGNPFFLEESVRTLVETHVLAGERGAYRLAEALPGIQVPTTVQAILASRIDRLPPEHKRLLQAASVVGETVSFSLLQVIADLSEEDLRRGLAHLQGAEFLYEVALFPELEYTFKHGLTYQVAYNSLLQERRRALHARILDATERMYADRLAEHVDRLALHASRGERWEKAVSYFQQAGAKAFARAANREATACFEQALAALEHCPKTRDALEQAIDLRFDLRNALQTLGQLDKVIEHLRDAEALARVLDDQRRLGWVSAYMSGHFWMTGHPTQAYPFAEPARAIAETLGDFALLAAANNFLSQATLTSGDYRRAEYFAREVAQSLEGDRSRERCGLAGFPAVLSRTWMAWSLAERGEFDAAIDCGREGVRLAEAIDHAYSLMWACMSLGNVHAVKGEIGEAIRLVERGRALSRDWNLSVWASTLTAYLGYLHAASGHLAEGLALLSEALLAMDVVGSSSFHSLLDVRLGEVHLLANRLEEGLAVAGRALARAHERGERGHEAHALRLLGEITARLDPPRREDAQGHYRRAMSVADDLGMRPLVAHCHLGLSKLYWRTGQRQEAQERLVTATTMYREMDMRFWLEQAEAEMREFP